MPNIPQRFTSTAPITGWVCMGICSEVCVCVCVTNVVVPAGDTAVVHRPTVWEHHAPGATHALLHIPTARQPMARQQAAACTCSLWRHIHLPRHSTVVLWSHFHFSTTVLLVYTTKPRLVTSSVDAIAKPKQPVVWHPTTTADHHLASKTEQLMHWNGNAANACG